MIALRHLPTLLNVDVDVEVGRKKSLKVMKKEIKRKLKQRLKTRSFTEIANLISGSPVTKLSG